MSYFVGIDIAKNKHDCFIVTGDGEVIRNSFTFPNNDEGFQILKATLDQLDHSQKNWSRSHWSLWKELKTVLNIHWL